VTRGVCGLPGLRIQTWGTRPLCWFQACARFVPPVNISDTPTPILGANSLFSLAYGTLCAVKSS